MGKQPSPANSLDYLVGDFLKGLRGKDFSTLQRAGTALRRSLAITLPGVDQILADMLPRGEGDVSYCTAAIQMALERAPIADYRDVFDGYYQAGRTYHGVRYTAGLHFSQSTLKRRIAELPSVILFQLTQLQARIALNRVHAGATDRPRPAMVEVAARRSQLLHEVFQLTSREAETLLLTYMNGNLSSSVIAQRMDTRASTIRTYRRTICRKIGVTKIHPGAVDRAHAIFLEHGIQFEGHEPKGDQESDS